MILLMERQVITHTLTPNTRPGLTTTILPTQGVGSDVPRYLRATGQVKNRRIGRSEANKLINGFWQYRVSSAEVASQPVCLFAFVRSVPKTSSFKTA